jgi:hypothetical protein
MAPSHSLTLYCCYPTPSWDGWQPRMSEWPGQSRRVVNSSVGQYGKPSLACVARSAKSRRSLGVR